MQITANIDMKYAIKVFGIYMWMKTIPFSWNLFSNCWSNGIQSTIYMYIHHAKWSLKGYSPSVLIWFNVFHSYETYHKTLAGGRFNIKMYFCQCLNSFFKDTAVSKPALLYDGDPLIGDQCPAIPTVQTYRCSTAWVNTMKSQVTNAKSLLSKLGCMNTGRHILVFCSTW